MSRADPAAGLQQVDVAAILDSARFSGLPLLVLTCAATLMVLDGLDIQIIGFAAPAVAVEFGIERSALAPALAAALVGMAIGGFLIGPFGDRSGRRLALQISVLLFGVATILAATSTSVWQLAFWRLVTGLGLGGALPNATALMAEYAPPKLRSQAIAMAIIGIPLGGMIGAAIAAEVIPAYGWRTMFVIGGTLPLIAFVVIYFVLPESARYLTVRGQDTTQLAQILNRIVGRAQFSGRERFVLPLGTEGQGSSVGLRGLFGPELARDTLALWIFFFTNLFAVYFFFNWGPTVLTSIGLPLETAVRGSLFFNLFGVAGALLCSWVVARIGSRWPVVVMGAVGAVAMLYTTQLTGAAETAAVGGLAISVAGLMVCISVAGGSIIGVQAVMYAVAAHVYPTSCRSTGVGYAGSVGRVAGVVSAFVGGAILAYSGGATFFLGLSVVIVLSVLGMLLLRRHVPPPRAGTPAGAEGPVATTAQPKR